jgi:hypothetical protein
MCTRFIVTVHRIVVDSVIDRLLQCIGLLVTVNIVFINMCRVEVDCDSVES